MRRFLIALTSVLAALLLLGSSASAHVFITDKTDKVGAVLHVVPDDDPIAGKKSNFYFDIQDEGLDLNQYTTWLIVTNQAGIEKFAPSSIADKTGVIGSYTFPTQGIYTLKLILEPVGGIASGESITFVHAQRVTRGITASPLDAPRYVWAEFGLVASVGAILLLIVIVVSRRSTIAAFTKW